MISNITKVSFSRVIIIPAILFSIIFSGCQNNLKPEKVTERSQLEWRVIQTRDFDTQNTIATIKALIYALQDEGYVIGTANTELGLVTASKEISEMDEKDKQFQEFWYGRATGYQTSKQVDVSCTVNTRGNNTKVRINLTAKGKTDTGGTLWSQPIDSPEPYQNIFNKIDKSIFLQTENL